MGLFSSTTLPYQYLFTSGTPQSAQQALAHVVQGEPLFSSLNQQRKIAACEALLGIQLLFDAAAAHLLSAGTFSY